MSIIDDIRARRSIRTFDGKPLSQEALQCIEREIVAATAPFGGRWTMKLSPMEREHDFRPSTYGIIRGARQYLLLGFAADINSAMSAGFAMEKVVLAAQHAGLGTCWIAATFRGSSFADAAAFPEETPLKIVLPVGMAAKRRSLIENITRTVARSARRLDMSRMFFAEHPGTPLGSQSPFYLPLSLMRLAPSSVNSQPWRAIVTNSRVDFFATASDTLAYVNMGIGLQHFAQGCEHSGINGRFSFTPPESSPRGLTYIQTFILS